MLNCSLENFTLVTAQQLKLISLCVVFTCLVIYCLLISKTYFLVYERVGVLVTLLKKKSLLGKVHFQPNSFRLESEVCLKKG